MAFDATALMKARRGKPDDFSGYPGGRRPPPLMAGVAPASDLHMAGGGNALLQAIQDSVGSHDLTAQNRRAKDPLARYRREQRLAMGIHLGRGRTDEDVRRAREAGLLPGGEAHPGQLQFTNSDGPSIGSQLANIRWHGHPDGPMDPEAQLNDVNALRQAALRAARSPRSQLYASRS